MVVVKRQQGDSDDKLIARFRIKSMRSGIVDEVRKRKNFVSRGERKKLKISEKKHRIYLDKKRGI